VQLMENTQSGKVSLTLYLNRSAVEFPQFFFRDYNILISFM